MKYSSEYYKKNKTARDINTRKWLSANPEKRLLSSARNRAKQKGLEFSISLEDIKIPEYCPIMGGKLTHILGHGKVNSNASLDRIDSSRGYTPDNIWVISDLANRMKRNATPEQLISFATGILNIYV